jgi:Icc-related predicted phosphoesterase
VDVNNALHAADVRWIEAEVTRAQSDGKRLVVVTHHAPLLHGTSQQKHAGSPLSCAFATDLTRLVKEPVVLWVHGHTHHTHDTVVGTCRVTANQRGYVDDPEEGSVFDPYSRVDIRGPTASVERVGGSG